MATLYRYFKDLWKLAVVALVLAAINQIFSLLDPLIFRHIIDSYATRYREYSSEQFLKGVSVLLGAAVDRKSTRLNSSHTVISYAVFCLKKKKHEHSNRIGKHSPSLC